MAHKAPSAGSIALKELGKSHAEISEAVGVSRAAVATWKRGTARPRAGARAKIFQAYGIAIDAWDQNLDASPSSSASAQTPSPVASAFTELPPYPKCPANPTPLEHARWSLACIAHDMQHRALPLSTTAKLRSEEARVLGVVARLQQAAELSEDRYVREHPAWLELRRRILDAVAPWPEASEALLEAMA